MKISKSFLVTVAILLIVGGWLYLRIDDWNNRAQFLSRTFPPQQDIGVYMKHQKPPPKPPGPFNVRTNNNPGVRQRADEMSDAERNQLGSLFATDLKPAVEKWAAVYGNHVPFSLSDLTMDKFVERLGRDFPNYHEFTFVIGDTTLGIVQRNGETYVQYLASKQGLRTMQTMPPNGASPDVSIPVTTQEVLTLAQQDCGHPFQPNEVRLVPSAMSGSMAGGVIADVGSAIRNAANIPISQGTGFSYVFQKDGTLAYYQRTLDNFQRH